MNCVFAGGLKSPQVDLKKKTELKPAVDCMKDMILTHMTC